MPEALNDAGPEVAALLLEAADQIAAYFGSDTNVTLEVFLDPEDEDDPGELVAHVQSPLKAVQARPMMERFWSDWWFLVAPRVVGKLNIGLELV